MFSVISRTLIGGVLPLCRGAVGAFYSPRRRGNFKAGRFLIRLFFQGQISFRGLLLIKVSEKESIFGDIPVKEKKNLWTPKSMADEFKVGWIGHFTECRVEEPPGLVQLGIYSSSSQTVMSIDERQKQFKKECRPCTQTCRSKLRGFSWG